MPRSMPRKVFSALCWFLACCLWLSFGGGICAVTQPKGATPDPDRACANCHKDIYDRYRQTPMARASGSAADGLLTGDFTHPASGIHYRLFLRGKKAFLQYDRNSPDETRSLHGEKELVYYIGSGTRGRTYLFQTDDFWFEAPVNWYSKQRVWDMAPNYGNATRMPFTLPIDPGCLHCHTSDVQASLPGERNHFAGAPFLQNGITCEACHGDPTAHLASAGKAHILNPSKLPAAKRDFVCLQCHLEGEVAVNRRGRSLADFRPGDRLYDDVAYFVHPGEIGANGRATSQWEALLQSECKRKSGDRLTCTTCHDPHSSPSAAQRVGYYRNKCLSCHVGEKYAAQHYPQEQDCASCHMPREKSKDIAHEQVTDHRIQIQSPISMRNIESGPGSESFRLTAIEGSSSSARDLGLAYAQMAEHGNRQAGELAMQLLQQAEREEGPSAKDAELHTGLGFLDQMSGDATAAAQQYRTALLAAPTDGTAAGDLAVLEAHSGDMRNAVQLWRAAFDENPGVTAAGFNLAVGECMLDDKQAAVAALNRVLLFSPDDRKARQLLRAITTGSQSCGKN